MSQDSPTFHKWSEYQVEKLIRLIETGASFHELVARLGCTESELEREALYLGVLLPKHETVEVSTHTSNSAGVNVQQGVMHFAPAHASSRPQPA